MKAIGGLKVEGVTLAGAYNCKIPLDMVHFANYQRNAIKKHVERIAAGWIPLAARPLSISYRERTFWCYDGRQTLNAMMILGKTHADAIVATGLTYQKEAQLFFIQNDVPRKMNGWKKFSSSLEAGNDVNQKLITLANDYNLSTPLTHNVHHAERADITNVGTLTEPNRKGGLPLVEKVFIVLSCAWRTDGKKSPVKSGAKGIDLIRGLFMFLHKNQDLQMRTVVDTLRGMEPDYVRSIANRKKSRGRIDATQFRMAFETVLTGGRRLLAA